MGNEDVNVDEGASACPSQARVHYMRGEGPPVRPPVFECERLCQV